MSRRRALDRMVAIDLSQVSQLDTAGAWLINRARHDLARRDVAVTLEDVRPEYPTLLEETHYRDFAAPSRPRFNVIFVSARGSRRIRSWTRFANFIAASAFSANSSPR